VSIFVPFPDWTLDNCRVLKPRAAVPTNVLKVINHLTHTTILEKPRLHGIYREPSIVHEGCHLSRKARFTAKAGRDGHRKRRETDK
jgi:hypothetical protein